jgi:hypothetical protein
VFEVQSAVSDRCLNESNRVIVNTSTSFSESCRSVARCSFNLLAGIMASRYVFPSSTHLYVTPIDLDERNMSAN